MTAYTPVITGTRMSDYGYWIVDVSLAPALSCSVMIAKTGITPHEARELALARLPSPERSTPPWSH